MKKSTGWFTRRRSIAEGALRAACAALVAGAAIAACGGNVEVSSGASGSAGSGNAGQGGSQTTSSSTGAVGPGGSTTFGGAAGDITTNPYGPCYGPNECLPGDFCRDFSNSCYQNGPGNCTPADQCAGTGPVCACDGTIYESDCAAFKAGVDLSFTACMPPSGGFLCGTLVCKVGAQSCVHYVGFAMYDACEAYPAACDPAQGGTPTCDCITTSAACTCAQDPDGNFVLKCNTGD